MNNKSKLRNNTGKANNASQTTLKLGGKKIWYIVLSFMIALSLVLSIILLCNGKDGVTYAAGSDGSNYSYATTSKVGYSAKYLGTVERTKPEVSNQGLDRYPVYGTTLSGADEEEKVKIISENNYLVASSSTYDSMDSEGNLYLNGEKTGRKLYKHSAADGMYYGNVSDDEQAIVKQITIQSRNYGDHITGLYAPAGEVIKIEMSAEDLAATGGLVVYIGQALQNGQANNIWKARELNRMPVILNSMTVSTQVGYVGSYLGGPIYVKPVNAGATFTVTISGGVRYAHYILGYTTEEEYEYNAQSTAPYFDCEIWENGIRFSGPISGVSGLDYDDFYNSCIVWEKIAAVSNQVPSGSRTDSIIGFMYDPFVAAGAAVAFPGRSSSNCPVDWMKDALNYQSFVEYGSWGNIHEYNHHHQRYGFAPGDEVTNNALSLVSYSLYTNISAHRTISGGGVTDWNVYTVPSNVLTTTINSAASGSANSSLDTYANILHSFGQDIFIEAAKYGNGNGGVDTWYKALSEATHYDMTYYFTELLHQTVSANVLEEYKARNYPMYVPVASVFQTGASYIKDGKTLYSETVKPFEIDAIGDFELDLNKYIVIPDGFTYEIVSVSQPAYGTITQKSKNVYLYSPSSLSNESGKFYVKIAITKEDGQFDVEDVELVFALKTKTNVLERTVYTYSSENIYKSATEAYNNNYAGYETVTVENNENPTQNSNTDIWAPNPSTNAVMEVKGKVYIPSDGKYRFIIRGRKYACFYTSLDGENYTLAGSIENTSGTANFLLDDASTYSDYELKEGQYVYFKEVLLCSQHGNPFIGLGWGKFDGDNVNISYLTSAIRQDAEYTLFTSEDAYPRTYTYTLPDDECEGEQTIIEYNYLPWDDNFPITNLVDEDESNYIHTDRFTPISEDNPFEVLVSLKQTTLVNKFVIYGETSRKYQPKTFTLYGGEDSENLVVLATVENAPLTGSDVVVRFDECKVKYYRLVVTDTYCSTEQNYLSFRGMKMFYEHDDFTLLSPDNSAITYYGDWQVIGTKSTFGHVYYSQDAKAILKFTGTAFALFKGTDAGFEGLDVKIDGKTVASASLENYGDEQLAYLALGLTDGPHTVEIKAKDAANIAGVAIVYSKGGETDDDVSGDGETSEDGQSPVISNSGNAATLGGGKFDIEAEGQIADSGINNSLSGMTKNEKIIVGVTVAVTCLFVIASVLAVWYQYKKSKKK